jgi:predicted glycosyltransferase
MVTTEETHLEKKSDDDEIVGEHKSVRHLTEVVITPEHAKRAESKKFIKNKNRLKVDGIHETTVPV